MWACGILFFASLVSIPGHKEEDDDGGTSHDDSSCDWCEHFKWAAVAAIVFGWPPVLRKAWGAVQHRTLDINTLMTIAVAGALIIGHARNNM